MKTTISKGKGLTKLLVISSLLVSFNCLAQSDALVDDTELVLHNEQLDIDGNFVKKETASDRIAKMRQKLEKQNEQMVQKKIENIRIREEQKLTNKLRNAFSGKGSLSADQVSTRQAVPVRTVVKEVPAPKKVKRNKILTSFGVSSYTSEKVDSFESKMNIGVGMESMVTDRIAVGFGIYYSVMDITDNGNTFQNYYYNNPYGNNFNTKGDEVEFKKFNLNLHSKFMLTTGGKINPYIGLGAGYNRMTLTYTDRRDQYNNFNYNYNNNNNNSRNNTVTGSNITGDMIVGTEVSFTDTIGMNLELRYTRALTNAFDEKEEDTPGVYNQATFNADQEILKSIGSDLENSNVVTVLAGLIIKF